MGIGSELWHYEWQEAHKLNSQLWLMQTEWDFNTCLHQSQSGQTHKENTANPLNLLDDESKFKLFCSTISETEKKWHDHLS